MTKKEKCAELMAKFFGPASATVVKVTMTEENCVQLCRQKVAGLLGEDKAIEFDSIK